MEEKEANVMEDAVEDDDVVADFVRASAVEMHVNMPQEPFFRKSAGKFLLRIPDQAEASTTTVRTPHCGHTVWGKKRPSFPFFSKHQNGSKWRFPDIGVPLKSLNHPIL